MTAAIIHNTPVDFCKQKIRINIQALDLFFLNLLPLLFILQVLSFTFTEKMVRR